MQVPSTGSRTGSSAAALTVGMRTPSLRMTILGVGRRTDKGKGAKQILRFVKDDNFFGDVGSRTTVVPSLHQT